MTFFKCKVISFRGSRDLVPRATSPSAFNAALNIVSLNQYVITNTVLSNPTGISVAVDAFLFLEGSLRDGASSTTLQANNGPAFPLGSLQRRKLRLRQSSHFSISHITYFQFSTLKISSN